MPHNVLQHFIRCFHSKIEKKSHFFEVEMILAWNRVENGE
jgi:hypothetical protein